MQFFSKEPGIFYFENYGIIHILSILITLGLIILTYNYRNKIKILKYHDKPIRWILAIILFLNMIIYYGSEILMGTYTYMEHLPLHFCFISGFLFMYILIVNNKKWFKFIYFFSFAGPLPAIIFPDLIVGPDRFMFWQWYISHLFFIFSSLYCLFVLEWKIEKKDMYKSMIYANIIFISVFIFNLIFKTNYIMTDKLPDFIIEMFPFTKIIDIPILWLEIAGFLSILMAYIPVILINNNNLKKKNKINM